MSKTRTQYGRLRRAVNGWGPVRRAPRAEFYPNEDGGISAGTTMVVDDPREPRIIATGILDEHGDMLCRVVVPIKLKQAGFLQFDEVDDEVVAIVPDSMLHVVDVAGEGVGFVDLSEVSPEQEAFDEFAQQIEALVDHLEADQPLLAELKKVLWEEAPDLTHAPLVVRQLMVEPQIVEALREAYADE